MLHRSVRIPSIPLSLFTPGGLFNALAVDYEILGGPTKVFYYPYTFCKFLKFNSHRLHLRLRGSLIRTTTLISYLSVNYR